MPVVATLTTIDLHPFHFQPQYLGTTYPDSELVIFFCGGLIKILLSILDLSGSKLSCALEILSQNLKKIHRLDLEVQKKFRTRRLFEENN